MTSQSPMLQLRGVTRRFGGLVAVNDLSMDVQSGTIHGLIGPNGAGKSTAFDLISGLTEVSSGQVFLNGREITHLPVEQRVSAGICRTFQTPKLFDEMSTLDVVVTGRHLHTPIGLWGSLFSVRRKLDEEKKATASAMSLLSAVGLEDKAYLPVIDLPYGERRLVEIARALATEARLLLLDEVTSGLNPVETAAVGELLRKLARDGLTIVLVEHDMKFVMGLCERITVMNFGSPIADGTPPEIANDENVIAAYLGNADSRQHSRRELRAKARAEMTG